MSCLLAGPSVLSVFEIRRALDAAPDKKSFAQGAAWVLRLLLESDPEYRIEHDDECECFCELGSASEDFRKMLFEFESEARRMGAL